MNFFKRYETKYLLSKEEHLELIDLMKEYMTLDKYGRMLITNIYFDTNDYRVIRRSLEKPLYKEKLRVRFYNNDFEKAFIELKKKYKKVVYKRRIDTSFDKMIESLAKRESMLEDSQIAKEIDYFLDVHNNPFPRVYLSYEREAFYCTDKSDFRMTFDYNILVRDYDVLNVKSKEGIYVLSDDYVLLEVKTGYALPEWLLNYFQENKIYKQSFSKYGYSYTNFLSRKEKENV